jgi:hypothetical protein
MPNTRVSLRRDQLILVNKVVNKKEQLKKGWRVRENYYFKRSSHKKNSDDDRFHAVDYLSGAGVWGKA